jgi:tetratricopeptide (TPR) repeat protein
LLLIPLASQSPAQSGAAAIATARKAMAAGVAAAKSGDLVEAKREFTRAVTLAPKIPEGHAALGSVLLSLKEFNDAAKELERAHSLSPADNGVTLNLADAETSLGRYAEAAKLFRGVLAQNQHQALSDRDSVSYATALDGIGEQAGAETALRDALQAFPDSSEVNDALGTVLAKRGAMDEAVPLFQQAVADNPASAKAQFHLGAALLALNQPADAIAPLKAAAVAQPHDFNAQLQLGRALSTMHEDAEALEVLHRATKLRTTSVPPEATYELGLALQASGDAVGSVPVFRAAISAGVQTNSAWTNLALAEVQTGEGTNALRDYKRALDIGPDSPTLREDYGVAFLQQADLDHAIEQFKAGLAIDPQDAHLHYDLGLALKLKDNLAAAVPEFERAAELDKTLPDPAYTLGIIYMQQGRFADAAVQLKNATALQPGNGDAWALLGSVLKDSGDPTGAFDALKHAIALEPDQPSLHIQLAALEVQAGDKEAATADRKIAAELSRRVVSRQHADFALKSGRLLLSQGKLDEAIVQLKIAEQAEPTIAETHKLLAEAYDRQGKAADAALERKSAASLDTGNAAPAPAQP